MTVTDQTRPERIVEPLLGVSTSNWIAPPYNRWAFRHVDSVARIARISRGGGPTMRLPSAPRALDTLPVEHEGVKRPLEAVLERTYTDGFIVVQDGAVVYERYFEGAGPTDRHLLMSVSKSLTAVLCGVLVGRGLLDSGDRVTEQLAELRGTAWEGCTIQHLLDMRAGIDWDGELDEYTILDVSNWRTHMRTGIPPSISAWIDSIGRDGEHGVAFRYSSLAADVLGCVLERATGAPFATVFAREIWSPMGAEADAYVILDDDGLATVEGGICTTLPDLARFGAMCLGGGVGADGDSVVPAEWLSRLRDADAELTAAFRASSWCDASRPHAFYHDNWWIWDAPRGIYKAAGMNGQGLWVHHPSRSVVAKLSSQPAARDHALIALQDAAASAVCDALA